MIVPGQFAVYGDSKVLGFGCFLEYMVVDFVCRLDYISFIGYSDVCNYSHLSGLKSICQSLSHSYRWSRSSCNDAASP